MKKRIAIISLILVLVVTAAALGGCGRAVNSSKSIAASATSTEAMAAPQAAAGFAGRDMLGVADEADVAVEDEYEDAEPMDAPESPATGGGGGEMGGGIAGPTVNPVIDSRKIIKNVEMRLQTLTFDSGVDSIAAIAERFGGYVQDSYVEGRDMYNERGTRYANFTVRIPSEQLDAFVNSLGGEFNVISKSQNSQDITDVYFDSKARLDALIVQEERLMSMLEKAEELEYLLQVEKELMNVRYEIESLTSSLARMDSYVSLSTVNIQLYEVVKYEQIEDVPVSFGDRIARAFSGSWVTFADFMQDLAVSLIAVLPFLLLIAAVAVLVIVVVRRGRKRTKKERPVQQTPPLPATDDNKDSE